MNEQRQHGTRQGNPSPGSDDAGSPASTEHLEAARDQVARIFAAADAILDGMRNTSSERFLDQVRQSGGQ